MRFVMMLALVLGACAPAIRTATPPAGFSDCYGEDTQAGYTRTDIVRSPHATGVTVHEESHIRDMRLFESCEAYHTFLRGPGNRARLEAAAYCAQAQAMVALRQVPTLTHAVEMFATTLAAYDTLELDVDSARALIWRFCS